MAGAWEPGSSHNPGVTREEDFLSEPEPSVMSLKGTDVEETVDTDLGSDLPTLIIDFNRSQNVKRANALAEMLERPDSVLKELTLGDSSFDGSEERMECRLTVIKALSRSTKLVRLKIDKATEEEVHELCKSLAANTVLEELDVEFAYAYRGGDGGARKLFGLLESNQSVKRLTLRGLDKIFNEKGVVACVGLMLAENCTLQELVLDFGLVLEDIEQVIRPLIGSADGEPPRNTSLLTLTIQGYGWIFTQEVAAVARMLRTNKSLLSLRLPNTFMASSPTDLIWKSLENNKTLQEFQISHPYDYDVGFMVRLLVEHNFTLKTIWYQDKPYSAEDVIQKVLEERGIHPESSGGRAFEGHGFLSPNMLTNYQVQPTKSISSPDLVPSHDIFVYYAEDGRNFAKQLHSELGASNYNVLNDPNSSNSYEEVLSKTSDQRLLALVVLSEGYVTSKQSMLELSRFIKRTGNSTLKVLPLFYHLDSEEVGLIWTQSRKQLIQEGQSQEEEIVSWNDIVKDIFDDKKALLRDLILGMINAEKFCTRFSGACDYMDFKDYDISEEECSSAVVKEIKKIIPQIKNSERYQMLGTRNRLEMESEVCLQKMTSVLKEEPLLTNQFLLQRALNKGDYLQQKYIEWKTFAAKDESEVENKYGKGCIIASLFPKSFLYYLKAQVLYGAVKKASSVDKEALNSDGKASSFDEKVLCYIEEAPNFDDKSCLSMLLDAAESLAKKWSSQCKEEHQSLNGYIDIGDSIDVYECIQSHGGIVAMCKYFHEGEPVGNDLQIGIVQDILTKIYCFGRVISQPLGGPIQSEAIGALGLTWKCGGDSPGIYVEDMREDGSYYNGKLEDFSYQFDKMNDEHLQYQCASKAFGDLEGAHFLTNGIGIKCSPLIIIALAGVTQSKGLKLSFDDKYGHMQIDSKLPEVKSNGSYECQILFTNKLEHLGVAVEWGMDDPMEVDTHNKDNHGYSQLQEVERLAHMTLGEIASASNMGATISSYESQALRKRTRPSPRMSSTTLTSEQVQTITSIYQGASQDKKKGNIDIKGAGSGVGLGIEKHNPLAKSITERARRMIDDHLSQVAGGYIEAAEEKHQLMKEKLTQCRLHASTLNYLVVYDNVKESHVSIYTVGGGPERFELEWETDIFLEGGRKKRKEIFKGLKGSVLTVKRDGTNYEIGMPKRKALKDYMALMSNKIMRRDKLCNAKEKLKELPEFGDKGSNDEWQHIIGEQENYIEHKFWWEASFMEAIVCSRTKFSSGFMLTTETTIEGENEHRIGHCIRSSIEELELRKGEGLVHHEGKVKAKGKFSKAPASQNPPWIYWGGLLSNPIQDLA